MVYEHKEKLTSKGWVDIHVMLMDLTEETLELEVVRDLESFANRDGLSDLANQDERTFGAINGSFFLVLERHLVI